jgi:hypothetical protein
MPTNKFGDSEIAAPSGKANRFGDTESGHDESGVFSRAAKSFIDTIDPRNSAPALWSTFKSMGPAVQGINYLNSEDGSRSMDRKSLPQFHGGPGGFKVGPPVAQDVAPIFPETPELVGSMAGNILNGAALSALTGLGTSSPKIRAFVGGAAKAAPGAVDGAFARGATAAMLQHFIPGKLSALADLYAVGKMVGPIVRGGMAEAADKPWLHPSISGLWKDPSEAAAAPTVDYSGYRLSTERPSMSQYGVPEAPLVSGRHVPEAPEFYPSEPAWINEPQGTGPGRVKPRITMIPKPEGRQLAIDRNSGIRPNIDQYGMPESPLVSGRSAPGAQDFHPPDPAWVYEPQGTGPRRVKPRVTMIPKAASFNGTATGLEESVLAPDLRGKYAPEVPEFYPPQPTWANEPQGTGPGRVTPRVTMIPKPKAKGAGEIPVAPPAAQAKTEYYSDPATEEDFAPHIRAALAEERAAQASALSAPAAEAGPIAPVAANPITPVKVQRGGIEEGLLKSPTEAGLPGGSAVMPEGSGFEDSVSGRLKDKKVSESLHAGAKDAAVSFGENSEAKYSTLVDIANSLRNAGKLPNMPLNEAQVNDLIGLANFSKSIHPITGKPINFKKLGSDYRPGGYGKSIPEALKEINLRYMKGDK